MLGFSLLDPSGTPVMVLDYQGRPSEAAVFDPYGSVLEHRTYSGAEQLHGNRLGRQGLFFERLDADVLAPQLHPGAAGLYQARNRTYLPGLGRWAQMDPNGAGQSLALGLLWHGGSPSLGVGLFDGEAMYGDGMGLFAYGANNPTAIMDPAGLFIGLLAPTSTLDVYSDYNDEAQDAGTSIEGWLTQQVSAYGEGQDILADMALDMSDTEADGFQWGMAGIALPGKPIGWHAHHVLCRFLGGADDIKNLVPLEGEHHRKFHQYLREELKKRGLPAPNKGKQYWMKRLATWDAKDPAKIKATKSALRAAARRFDSRYGAKYGFKMLDVVNRELSSVRAPKALRTNKRRR